LFDGGPSDDDGADAPLDVDVVPIGTERWDKSQTLAFEKEMLGAYVSDHPLFGLERVLRKAAEASLAEVPDMPDGDVKTFGGVVTNLVKRYTKRGDLMMSFDLEDLDSSVEVLCFPKVAADYGHELVPDRVVLVKGRIDRRDDAPKITAIEVRRLDLALEVAAAESVTVEIDADRLPPLVERLRSVLSAHPGETPVLLKLVSNGRITVFRLGLEYCVEAREGLYAELRSVLGPRAVVA
jgi:DNA polymerase-3 subunit alpha